MSFFSKQKWFCNNCGAEQFSVPRKAYLADDCYSVCSAKCRSEMNWKSVLSNLGKEYYPEPEEKKPLFD